MRTNTRKLLTGLKRFNAVNKEYHVPRRDTARHLRTDRQWNGSKGTRSKLMGAAS